MHEDNSDTERAAESSAAPRGFGLQIVKHVVSRVGGNLSIRNKPHQGTTVHLGVPSAPSIHAA